MNSKSYGPLLLLVTAIYFAAGELGLSQAFLHANVSPVWPPTGIAIAAVWLLGYGISPAILLGAFLVNLATGISITTAVGIAAGNTLEAVSAVFLLHRFVGSRTPFFRAQDTVRFVLIIGLVSTTLAATIGNLSLCLSGAASWANFGPLWLTWWLGDSVGALVVTPLLLTWIERPSERWSLRQLGEALALLVSLLLVANIVFGGLLVPRVTNYPLEHLMVPFLLWAAFAFGPRGAAAVIAVLSGVAIWGTRQGFGPFAAHGPNESLLLLQVFVAAVAITTLVLAAIVSERKKTVQALRSSETQLQLVTDITPMMLTQCSRDMRYRFVNRSYAEMFGLTPKQILGKPIVEITGQEALEAIRPHVESVLKGDPVEFEAEIPYRQAGNRFMRVTYMPDRDEHGEVIGWIASISDMTERKRAAEQIENLNAELQRRIYEFQALIDTAPAGIGVAQDPECNYIWGNPEFGNMLGTHLHENISMSGPARDQLPFRILRDGIDMTPDQLPMQRACRENRELLDEELEIIRTDGSTIHELCRATPLRDEHGRVRGCIGVFLNITERKQAEKERERLLAREQEARAEAEDANRVKDEFLAVISHELRTPLNSILGWAQLLRSGRLDTTTTARGLEAIERNAKAQAQLVDDLLDVSSIVSSKLRLDVKPIELTSAINSAIDSVRHALDAKEIQLDVTVDPAARHVQGDQTRLQQIMWNLLSNAVRFTPKAGRIEIGLRRNGDNAQLSVTDTGQGIGAEFLPYVFDRFRQEDSSRARRHGGLGLGLAIVRHLVEMHGGQIEAYSAGENQGARFTVTLPLAEEAGDLDNVGTTVPIGPGQVIPRLFGIRMLIVEDNPDSLEMLRIVVESHGAVVKTATTASEALRTFEEWSPDVLVSDIGLPDEDGFTLIQKIKTAGQGKAKQIHAIALTGYAGEQEGQRALAAGFQLCLTKPTEPIKLIEAIANLAGGV